MPSAPATSRVVRAYILLFSWTLLYYCGIHIRPFFEKFIAEPATCEEFIRKCGCSWRRHYRPNNSREPPCRSENSCMGAFCVFTPLERVFFRGWASTLRRSFPPVATHSRGSCVAVCVFATRGSRAIAQSFSGRGSPFQSRMASSIPQASQR